MQPMGNGLSFKETLLVIGWANFKEKLDNLSNESMASGQLYIMAS